MDLVVLSEVRWSYFRTRKQFLLSRFPERWRIWFAQPPAFGADDPWRPRTEGRVTYFTVPFLKPATRNPLYNALTETPPGRWIIERAAEAWLTWRLRNLGVGPRPVLLVSNIYCPGALSRLHPKLIFYDFNDSPFQFAGVRPWWRPYWPATLEKVDTLFVVSKYFQGKLEKETSKPLVLLPNGVEWAHFEAPRPEPADIADLPRPRIGYVGLLSHFLDFEKLEALRQARGTGTIVLIGPESPAIRVKLKEFAAREGVVLLGPKPYADVPAYMQAFDVGMLPWLANDYYVRGMSTNKTYQYLAAGIPAVVTPIFGQPEEPPHLTYASTPDETVAAVAAALAAPRDPKAKRALARAHDWDPLAAKMVSTIESRLAAVP